MALKRFYAAPMILFMNALFLQCVLVGAPTAPIGANQGSDLQDTMNVVTTELNQIRSEMFQMTGELKSTMSQVQTLTQENLLLRNKVDQLELKTQALEVTKEIVDNLGAVQFWVTYKDNWVFGQTRQVMKFDEVLTNVGNGYDVATGIFTCPLSGLYLMSIRAANDYRVTNSTKMYVHLMKNQKELVTTKVEMHGGTGEINGRGKINSDTVPVMLVEGDQLYVQPTLFNSNDWPGYYAFFWGILVSPVS